MILCTYKIFLLIIDFKLKVTPMLASSNILFLIEFLQKWIIKGLYLAALSRCDDRCLKHARYITFQGHCYSGCHGCQGTCWDLTTSARQPFWWVHNLWTPKRNKTEEVILSLSCAKLLMQRNFNATQHKGPGWGHSKIADLAETLPNEYLEPI